MTISWKAKGDGTDEETQRLLDQSVGTIRRKLSEAMSNATVPQLKFVADRTHLIVEEMNQLFAKADYGMQYRALSNTGAVLGSMSDSGIKGSFSENHQSEIQKNAESKTQSVLGKFSEDEGPREKNKPDR
ncbi:hypothetical protein AB6A40_009249 [Gnathostoma spinigerum]|uniref:Tumor protein D54 n=1 Tax=Gnathostoma spinigerum TaxID=75299 RepID=A0ABD6ESL8_9BILA